MTPPPPPPLPPQNSSVPVYQDAARFVKLCTAMLNPDSPTALALYAAKNKDLTTLDEVRALLDATP